MDKKELKKLFELIHPDLFGRPYIRELPDDEVFDEMILPLGEFDEHSYEKELGSDITFGFYTGDTNVLKKAIAKVDEGWTAFFTDIGRTYCGYIGGKIASFCVIEDMGEYDINGRLIKVGGPGCVGTLPEYRGRGIALTMVKQATQILKDEGFDISWIHYTGVAPWYEKLGYRVVLRWNRNGIIRRGDASGE